MKLEPLTKEELETLSDKGLGLVLPILENLYRKAKYLFPWPKNVMLKKQVRCSLDLTQEIIRQRTGNET